MSAVFKLARDSNDLIRGNERMNRVGYFEHVLNKDFLDLFMGMFNNDIKKLQEFVFGIDTLTDLTRVENVPTGRLLNTPDVTPDFVKAMSFRARETRDFSLFGCQVCPRAEELVQEFFSYDYLALYGEFFKKTRLPFCLFELDGVRFELSWVNDMGLNAHTFSALRFTNTENNKTVFFPFNKERLVS